MYARGVTPASSFVDVEDGCEVKVDLRTGESPDAELDDTDLQLGDKLRRQVRDADANQGK